MLLLVANPRPPDAQLGDALFRLAAVVVRQRPRDISLTAASTLGTLERSGPRRITQLALSEGVAQPSMTALVAQLERLGLVERREEPADGRVVLVAITEEGSEYLRAARQQTAGMFAALLEELTPAEAAALRVAAPALDHLLELANGPAPKRSGAGRVAR